jgi:hypothetical protein
VKVQNDNQVHVGLIQLLEKMFDASQTGIAGCVIIEDEVLFGDK